ncbi:YEATS domain-containing protein 4 isoform X3 [Belonocnema kinseyi]|uniref:YEATS domain-containing protein 4 isoform X3 n=1 Tax=Belonocnema kinseyi TaxID=2817044 RepID=UPI00143CEA47|nr:YEATS domain-containing protein 4 isoform X3 [Belonocnema kinseyi]
MTPTFRKNKNYSIPVEVKLEALSAKESGLTTSEVSSKYGIARTTIGQWFKDKENLRLNWLKQVEEASKSKKRKKHRTKKQDDNRNDDNNHALKTETMTSKVTIYHVLKLFQNPDNQMGKKSLVSEFYEEIVFQDPTALMQHLLTSTKPLTMGPWRHETDFEAKKESALKAIMEARNKVRSEVGELKEKLTLARETIAKFKEEIAKVSKSSGGISVS